jgi:pyruvate/2-oxoglutarate dehydrogenase complex dihydrolipoamide acyltransferase (E2) component
MTIIVTLPKTGDTADTVVLLEWLVVPGDRVADGQPLVRVETAKVEVEIPAPAAGTLLAQLAAVDDEVAVGDPLAEIDPD